MHREAEKAKQKRLIDFYNRKNKLIALLRRTDTDWAKVELHKQFHYRINEKHWFTY